MKTRIIKLSKQLSMIMVIMSVSSCSMPTPQNSLIDAWEKQAYQSYNLTVPQSSGFIPTFFKAVSAPQQKTVSKPKPRMPQKSAPITNTSYESVNSVPQSMPIQNVPAQTITRSAARSVLPNNNEQQFIAEHYGL